MATQTNQVVDKSAEKNFQVYKSSMKAHRIITPWGKTIHVSDYKYITNDVREIAFLDDEIEKGFPYIRKGDAISTAVEDPMAALRAQIAAEAIAQYKAEQEALEAGKDAVKVADSSTGIKPALTPASAKTLAGLTAGSNSGDAK